MEGWLADSVIRSVVRGGGAEGYGCDALWDMQYFCHKS